MVGSAGSAGRQASAGKPEGRWGLKVSVAFPACRQKNPQHLVFILHSVNVSAQVNAD